MQGISLGLWRPPARRSPDWINRQRRWRPPTAGYLPCLPSPLLLCTWVWGCVHGGVGGGHLGGRGPAALATTSSAASRPAGCVVGGKVGRGVVGCVGSGGGCVVGGSVDGVGGGVGGVGGCCGGGGLGVGGVVGDVGLLGLPPSHATRGPGPGQKHVVHVVLVIEVSVPGSVGCLGLSPRPATLLKGAILLVWIPWRPWLHLQVSQI